MALQLKYTDEHGILHIDMGPTPSPVDKDISDPKFDTINNRFGQYDLFGAKYDEMGGTDGGETHSLFRSRYNSLEEELANTPYAFATERSLRLSDPVLDITIDSNYSKDIDENDRYFDLFGPKIDINKSDETPAFTVTQLIHAQDRYFDLSSRSRINTGIDSAYDRGIVRSIADNFEVKSAPCSAKRTVQVSSDSSVRDDSFKVLSHQNLKSFEDSPTRTLFPALPTSKRKKETSFAIITEQPISRPSSPRSLPVEIRPGRVSPFKGRGFREETSRHNTPKTSATNSRNNSPPRRTKSLTRFDNMAQTATLPIQTPILHKPPRDFLKENIEEIRELSELNREKHEAEAEKKRHEEEIALLKEMGILDKKGEIRSVVNSRSNSRSNSPNKINLRSRSNSPSAILHYENIESKTEFNNKIDRQPVMHKSRVRSISKSQPQSNNGSPKHSKIPKRQSSVSPTRSGTKRPADSKLKTNQKYISNSTSNLNETIRIGSQVHDKRVTQSTQHLDISPSNIKGKPPISPGRGGPPPTNKSINAKRLSPIVGTPSRSPLQDSKPGSAKTPGKSTPISRKPIKTVGNTPATSKLGSKQTSKTTSRDSSPEKRNQAVRSSTKITNSNQKTTSRIGSTKITPKPLPANKTDSKKPISRTNSIKSLTRTPSTKNLYEKPPLVKRNSKKDISEKSKPTAKINGDISKNESKKEDDIQHHDKEHQKDTNIVEKSETQNEEGVTTQDNETQYDKITNENGELLILTKKNIVSMTTAAITSQPLEVVTTVTNQLPAAFEKAREKGIFERLSSKDSLVITNGHGENNESKETKETVEEKDKTEKLEKEDKKPSKSKVNDKALFCEDNVKLKLLQPPYNNPQVERVRQKIDSILKEPEISPENILAAAKAKEMKEALKQANEKVKSDIKDTKAEISNKISEVKDKVVKESEKVVKETDKVVKESDKATSEISAEVTKIIESITPVETPQEVLKPQEKIKENIEPIVTVVNEKKDVIKAEVTEKINETLVQGGPEVEVQSSNLSTPADKMTVQNKTVEGNGSEKSHSNGGYSGSSALLRFPQSTSTTPKPPPRTKRDSKENSQSPEPKSDAEPKPNICARLMGKCKSKCCPCCIKGEDESESDEMEERTEGEKKKFWSKMNCCAKKVPEEDVERAAGKGSTIEFESETKRKRKLRDILCGCCRRQRVADVSEPPRHAEVTPPVMSSDVVQETGCCGKKRQAERRDSILSDQAPSMFCNNRFGRWIRGACRRQSEQSSSRRTSLFSKNKSLSPTLPPEDTRKKLDPSLVEHTSAMRGAIPILPVYLAYFCLFCNIIVPGLGTIFSGMFCMCFGIPRFGVHDGAKYRIGAFLINLVMGCGQLFTVLFCLVGWGWSIWWGVIMVRISRKYKRMQAEAQLAQEAEAPPVTANNHTRA